MKRHSTNRTTIGLQHVIMAMLLVAATIAHGTERDPLLHADAESSAAHQSSKTFFLEKAAASRSNAEEHRELRQKYLDRGLTIIARHCLAIAERYDEIAESYDSIAGGHADLSNDGRSKVSGLHNGHTPADPSP